MFSLVLGGGGAKGYIHLGVYKYLLEKNRIPDDIVGTSMGAIIGTMIAFGRGYDRIYKEIENFAIYKIVGFPSRNGMIPYQKVKNYSKKLFGDLRIEDSIIPLAIVSFDIHSGQKIVFRKGPVCEALIASFSIPGIFTPHEREDHLFVDGGLVSNLPCEESSSKNILAISAFGISKSSNKKLNVFRISMRSIIYMALQNETLSLLLAEKAHKSVTLLRPDLSDYEMYHFEKYKQLIEIGYTEAKTQDLMKRTMERVKN